MGPRTPVTQDTDKMAPNNGKQAEQRPAELAGSVPVPAPMLQQAAEAAASNANDSTPQERHHAGRDVPPPPAHSDSMDTSASEIDIPPPAYGDVYGNINEEQEGFGTNATVTDDGRVNIRINQRSQKLSSMLVPALRQQQQLAGQEHPPPPPYVPPSLGGEEGVPPPPPMNVVIHVVGSRGDVQPFVALGKVLKDTYGHRVRLATHPVFQGFVHENGLEFFNIGGDPAELMAFMVKNPGLMPGFDTLRSGDVGSRRKEIKTMVRGCWRSCFEAGDGLGPAATDETTENWSAEEGDFASKPFVADAIIANPPSFAHIHCAEKLGIPLHIMFTMPYSPTQAFPHPLANIQSSNADTSLTNYMSYALVDMMTWQGLGDIINRFRTKTLGLDEIGLMWAPGMLQRLRIPHTYCWSPALIPKPKDWGGHISISGFYFLNLATNYTPDPELQAFLDAGPPPVYIGFGSIVLDDPNTMTKTLFEAVRKSGQRALVSKGWGGMGADELGKPDNVYMLGNVPHDWLFQHVSAVVHHGGAGTTAAGITAGKPTLVVPFFGDQPFWGAMVARAGAGPDPIPHKQLTADNLAEGINVCLKPESQERAKELANKIAKEKGSDEGGQAFHQYLDVDSLRCSIAPSRMAVWRLKRTQVRLSAMAACTLANEGLLEFKDLKLLRAREYESDAGPYDPISGGATALIGTMSTMMMGVADFPIETLKALKIHPDAAKKKKDQAAATASEEGDADRKSIDTSTTQDDRSRPASSRASTQSEHPSTASPDLTPTTSRSGSTFNVQESLAKIQSPSSGRSMSSALQGTLSPPLRSQSRSNSRSNSRDGRGKEPNRSDSNMLDTAMGTGRGVHRIVGAGFKSPMDFSLGVAKGFHNAPKLYGDESVRKADQVTDFKSGLRAATKEFGFGMYDGITGLVTQPMKGAQKEGAAGFVKGIGKGIGGVVLKPSAAIFGIPGYTMKGVYKELQKQMGSSVQNYIIAARTAQGYDDWTNAYEEERQDVVRRWEVLQKGLKKKKNPDELVKEIFEESRRKHQAWIEAHRCSRSHPSTPTAERSGSLKQTTTNASSRSTATAASAFSASGSAELEENIAHSVRETSRGNAEEDAAVERAIRASMAELARASGAANEQDDESEALRKAMEESLRESRDGGARDEELEKALAASLREHRGAHGQGDESDGDEELQRALHESQNAVTAGPSSSSGQPSQEQQAADPGHLAGTTREEFEAAAKSGRGEKSQREIDEEKTVLEYVKKQSLLEEKHRAGKAGGESSESAQTGVANDGEEEGEGEDEELRKAMEMSLRDAKG